MESLLRTRVDRFDVKGALKLADIEAMHKEGKDEEFLLQVDRLFEGCPSYTVKNEMRKAAENGNCLMSDMVIRTDEKVRIYDDTGRFYGLYENHPDRKGVLRPFKMFL